MTRQPRVHWHAPRAGYATARRTSIMLWREGGCTEDTPCGGPAPRGCTKAAPGVFVLCRAGQARRTWLGPTAARRCCTQRRRPWRPAAGGGQHHADPAACQGRTATAPFAVGAPGRMCRPAWGKSSNTAAWPQYARPRASPLGGHGMGWYGERKFNAPQGHGGSNGQGSAGLARKDLPAAGGG